MAVIGLLTMVGIAVTMLAGELYIGGVRERSEMRRARRAGEQHEPGF